MNGERLAIGSPEASADLADVTGSYIATLATFGTVHFPPVRSFRSSALVEAQAPVVTLPAAEAWPPISMAIFQAPQQNTAHAPSALARSEWALAA